MKFRAEKESEIAGLAKTSSLWIPLRFKDERHSGDVTQ